MEEGKGQKFGRHSFTTDDIFCHFLPPLSNEAMKHSLAFIGLALEPKQRKSNAMSMSPGTVFRRVISVHLTPQYTLHLGTPYTSIHLTPRYTSHLTPRYTSHLTPRYTSHLGTPYTSIHLTPRCTSHLPRYTLHLGTPYTSVHLTPRYTLHLGTLYTSVHLTPRYTLHLGTPYTSVHFTPRYPLHTPYTSVHFTPPAPCARTRCVSPPRASVCSCSFGLFRWSVLRLGRSSFFACLVRHRLGSQNGRERVEHDPLSLWPIKALASVRLILESALLTG